MKRKIAILMLGIMLVSMTACIDPVREEPPTVMPDLQSPSPEVSSEIEAALTYDYSVNPKSSFVMYESSHLDLSKSYPDSYEILVSSFCDEFKITSDYPALAAAVEKWNTENVKSVTEVADEFYNDALEYCNDEYFFGPYAYEETAKVQRADERVFSIDLFDYSYMGGAHPGTYSGGVNFDTQTGKILSLEDVFPNEDTLVKALVDELEANYDTEYFFYVDDSETPTLDSYIKRWFRNDDGKLDIPFCLTYSGVVFNFGEYGLDSYAGGSQSVCLSYDKYWQIMNEYYAKEIPTDYVMTVNTYGDACLPDNYQVSGINYDENGEFATTLEVRNSDNVVEINDLDIGDIFAYLVSKNGKKYLMVDVYSYYEYYSKLFVFDISGDAPVSLGEYDGWVESVTDPCCIKVMKDCDVLSTYAIYAYYEFNDEGKLDRLSEYYLASPYYQLKSVKELTGDAVDPKTFAMTGSEQTFPAGTTFDIMATNGENVVILKSQDGVTALFDVSLEWPQTIEGESAEDCFEELYYAG